MGITDLAIRRPVFAVMLVAAFVGFGAVSFTRIGVDLFPEVNPGIVGVQTVLEGGTPQAVETEISDVLEEQISGISGLDDLSSTSREGVSVIIAEFDLDEDIDVVSQEVRDKVSRAMGDLPRDARVPVVEKFSMGSQPILTVMVSGPLPVRELTDFADDVVKARLQRIPGVGAISIEGGREREIRVWIDGSRLRSYGLTVSDVARAIAAEHADVPGGRLEAAGGTAEFSVKTKGEVVDIAQFRELVVAYRAGGYPTRLGDVARIEDGLSDERTYAELDGVTGVSLAVRKQSGRNTAEIARAIRSELSAIQRAAPADVRLQLARDNSRFIESAARDVGVDLFLGGGLAMLATLAFLRSVRTTLIVGITIPTAIISTFILFYAMGFTLNMFSMMALSVSIGLLVDDAIVVLESVHRRISEGEDPILAASRGTQVVSTALFAGTLSILSVFVPIAFMQGFVGRYFFEYGLSISFAVIMSLLFALTLTPMLCSRLLRRQERHGRLYGVFERGYQAIERFYGRLLRWALQWRLAVVGIAVGATAAGIFLAGLVPVSLDPKVDRSEFQALVELPTGAGLEQSKEVGGRAARLLADLPHVRTVALTVGGGRGRVNEALLYAMLDHKTRRELSQFEIQDLARARLRAALPEARRVSVFKVDWAEGGGFSSYDLEYSLLGPDLDTLAELGDQVVAQLARDPYFQDAQSSYQIGKPEVQVQIDRRRAADLGTPVRAVADTVRALIGGVEVGTYQEGGERHDVRVRLEESQRDDLTEIGRLQVRAADGSLVDLANVAALEVAPAPVQIDRRDRSREVKIYANVPEGVAEGTATARLEEIVAGISWPAGYTHKHAGQTERAKESASDISFAFLMALVALYMVIASQFNSFAQPLIIMVTAPLSFVGAFAGLYLTGTEFSIFAQIGILALMGLVMKNGILLVDYANQRVAEGVPPHEAMAQAGPARLRPVMMTAVSTVAGMVPVAIATSDAAEWRAPMGILIIGGLSSSMLLTLVVAPVFYTLMADAQAWITRLRAGRTIGTAPGR